MSVSQHNPSEVIIKHGSAGTAATPVRGGIHYHCQHITNHTQYSDNVANKSLHFTLCLLESRVSPHCIRCDIGCNFCIFVFETQLNVLHQVIDKFCAVQLRIVLCTINSSPLSAVVRHVCAKYLQEKSSKLITEFATTTWPPWSASLLPPRKDTQLSLASTDNVVEERHYFVQRNNSLTLTIHSDCQIVIQDP